MSATAFADDPSIDDRESTLPGNTLAEVNDRQFLGWLDALIAEVGETSAALRKKRSDPPPEEPPPRVGKMAA